MVVAKKTGREEKEGEWDSPRGPNCETWAELEGLVKNAEKEWMD